ncbi:MAG: nicotinamide-nucleotide amidohydrolase family protein [Synergistaceae bacterium]|nr:nicotinamide-nucleotide amidohydrolase family protein [Synergistaceae bacterium]
MGSAVLAAIGDELLSGARLEKNASFMAGHLHNKGWEVKRVEVIPDEEGEITALLTRWVGRTDLLILSGGLGPTHDDRTRYAIAKYLGCGLSLNDEMYDRIVSRVKHDPLRLAYTERCRDPQALIPDSAQAVFNPAGSALGIRFESNGTTTLALPGVPMEYQAMTRQELPEIFAPDSEHCWASVIILGVPELTIAERVPEVIANPELHVSILPAFPQVELIIRGEARGVSEAERVIRSRFRDDVLPQGCSSLAEAVLYEARFRGARVACAESCTGGLIGAALTEIAGSSDVFSGGAVVYSNEAKSNILGVRAETLREFGAVSEECAREMAGGALRIYGADFAVSVTGIAGPDGGSESKPVGTVCFGFASDRGTRTMRRKLPGNREEVRSRTVRFALSELWRMIHDAW